MTCGRSTAAKALKPITARGYPGRLPRVPAAGMADMVMITLMEGSPTLRKQVFAAVVVRQARAIRRPGGTRLSFENNAAVIMTPEGELKGTEIRGPVAKEAAERWPRVANLASTVI